MHKRQTLQILGTTTLFAALSLGAACSNPGSNNNPDGGGSGGDGGSSPKVTATCEMYAGANICHGTVSPPATGVGIVNVMAGSAVGKHFFCYPGDAGAFNNKLVIHLVHTGEDPATANAFPKRACALGFAAIAPMYPNPKDAREACGNAAACYTDYRVEVVEGKDRTPAISVDAANSINGRVESLLSHLGVYEATFGNKWAALVSQLGSGDYSGTVLSGHEQGAGHALRMAHDHAVERLIMLAGPTDRLNSGMAGSMAPTWIQQWSTDQPLSLTAAAKFFGYNHADDSVAIYSQVDDNYTQLGLAATPCTFQAGGGYAATCRRIMIPTAGCTGQNAHQTPAAMMFDNNCTIGGAANNNLATWQFLLTAQ